jgi:hypothetical protein
LFSNDEEKRLYAAIREENSTECKGKCHYTQYHNAPFIIKIVKVKKKITLEDLKKKYDD